MCLFCKIANKEIPAKIVYEDDEILAFLDVNPLTDYHTLVIPKKHSKNMLDTDDHTLQKLITTSKRIAKKHLESSDAKGFNLIINNNAEAFQTIDHIHFHIVYRNYVDELEYFKVK